MRAYAVHSTKASKYIGVVYDDISNLDWNVHEVIEKNVKVGRWEECSAVIIIAL